MDIATNLGRVRFFLLNKYLSVGFLEKHVKWMHPILGLPDTCDHTQTFTWVLGFRLMTSRLLST